MTQGSGGDMKEISRSDSILDAVKQREEKRRRKEEAEAAFTTRKQTEENQRAKEMRLSN